MPEHIPPDLIELRERVQRFCEEELRPLEDSAADDEDDPTNRNVRKQVAELSRKAGFFGMTQPKEFGGSEAGPLALTVAREAFAATNLRTGRFAFGPGPGVLRQADGRLRDEYLEPLMRGQRYAGWGFTEPSGPEAGRPTWAKRDGDDLVINGRKAYVSGGSGADFYAVLLNVDEDASGPGGTAMVLVDRDAPGVSLGPDFRSVDGSTHCQLLLNDACVPQTNIVGKVGEGLQRGLGNIGQMRLGVAARAAGLAMWVADFTQKQISQPHRAGGALADREQVRWLFGNMLMEVYAARSVLYRTARLAEEGADVMNEGAIAKVLTTETAGRVVDTAIQLTGGQALIEGHPLEALYRQVRALRLAEGASDLLRLNVARGLLEFQAGRV
ncbi:MAG: acyl-CoA dehydrogenase [Dehalococcoidia bacterium]|nr:acyl-CoA dehydrogenase [Dehalococcoidia bacterium]